MKYTKTHEWIEVKGDVATLGITDHAQEQLSDVVYVDFPQVGDSIKSGESFMVIESVKAASDIYAPIDGEIVAINQELSDSPELVNQSPQEKGWLVEIKMTAPEQTEKLLDKNVYLATIDAC